MNLDHCYENSQSCTLKNMALASVEMGKNVGHWIKYREYPEFGLVNFIAGLLNMAMVGFLVLKLLNFWGYLVNLLWLGFVVMLFVPGSIGMLIGFVKEMGVRLW